MDYLLKYDKIHIAFLDIFIDILDIFINIFLLFLIDI